MQQQVAKYTLLIIGLVFLFTGIAASATPVRNFTLKITNNSNNRNAQLTGTIVAEESGIPLAHGQFTINGQTFEIDNGKVHIEDVPVGKHRVTIDGPYRKTTETVVTINNGHNELELAVDSVVNQAEIDMLARITRAEAEGESLQGQIAVAASVLNRVNSSRYPTTVRDVVYQRVNGRYQYSPVRDGRIRLAPRATNYQAAYHALAGEDPSYGATGFFAPAKTRDRWVRSQPVTTRIGGHTFFKY